MLVDDELIGPAEAAEILHVSTRTLRRWSDAGVITPVDRLPGRTGPRLYSRADVEQLAESMAGQTGRPA